MYNLDRLIDVNVVTPFGFLKTINEYIQTYGGYAATIVLIVWVAKGFLWFVLIFNTVMQQGKNVAVALLYAMCCGFLLEDRPDSE